MELHSEIQTIYVLVSRNRICTLFVGYTAYSCIVLYRRILYFCTCIVSSASWSLNWHRKRKETRSQAIVDLIRYEPVHKLVSLEWS